ncbi:MAG: cation:proton antiporter [bacterium]
MVKVIIGAVLLLTIGLAGYRRTFTKLRLPLGARYIYLTGTEFILVGLALGSSFLGLLDESTIRGLTPLYSLGLGFIGLLFGIQLELNKLLRLPRHYFLVVVVQALVTMGVVFLPCWFLLRHVFGAGGGDQLLAAFVLAATASCTGVTTLVLMSREKRLRSTPFLELLRYIASLDAVVGLCAVGIAYGLMHDHTPFGAHFGAGALAIGIALAIGLIMGLLFHVLTQIRCTEEELLIFVMGIILFAGGMAEYLKLSPLFVCMLTGITMANISNARDRIFFVLARLEHPFYVVLLILAGAIWRVDTSWAWIFAALYLALRAAGKVTGGYLAPRAVGVDIAVPRRLGFGLISQGGIAVAIVLNYHLMYPSRYTSVVVTSVLLAVIINELVSPVFIRNLLRRAGEVPT